MRPAALLTSLACAALTRPSLCAWPWETSRYFADAGDAEDDVAFAGLPEGSGFKTTGLTSCECDLTANACDPFCCCDSACSDFERETLFECADEASISARPGVVTCADAAAVISANLPETSKAAWEADEGDPLSRVLCVAADNSASYGDFISPMAPLSSGELEARALPNSSFAQLLRTGPPSPSREAHYEAGQPLNKGTGSGDGATADEYAPLALPGAPLGGSAGCAASAPLRFLQQLPPSSCVTAAPQGGSLADLCVAGGALDASAYDGLLIGSSGLRPGSSGYGTVRMGVGAVWSAPIGSESRWGRRSAAAARWPRAAPCRARRASRACAAPRACLTAVRSCATPRLPCCPLSFASPPSPLWQD